MKAYSEYQDSQIEWLEKVPTHWDVISIKGLFQRIKRTNFPKAELLSVYRDFGVIPKSTRDDNNNKESDDLTPYQLVKVNDLVMNKMKAWQGSIAISEYEGIVSPAYYVYSPRASSGDKIYPKYIHYLLRNPMYITQYMSRSKGIRVNQWDLDAEAFEKIEVLLPPKSEQKQIYSFLDKETARIDTLIEEKQSFINLLEEKRQALISHVVTKGLDDNVEMKDSGVEWIDEIPAHWTECALRRHVIEHRQGYYTTDDYVDDGVKLLRITDLEKYGKIDGPSAPRVVSKGDLKNYYLKTGDFVFARTGGAGTFGLVGNLEEPMVYASYLIRFRFNKNICPQFLKFAFQSKPLFTEITKNVHGGVNQNIHAENIKDAVMPFPEYAEQYEIATYLEAETGRILRLKEEVLKSIELLNEHRAALISAAVTGKIDVREEV
jgi:type I restriction enzyme S subunit